MSSSEKQDLRVPPDPPAGGYQDPYPFEYPILQLNLFSILVLFLFVPVLSTITTQLQGGTFPIMMSTFSHAIGVLLVGILTILLHEHIHGFTMRRFGYLPRYGFNWKMFAAFAIAEEQFMSREHALWIALAPFAVLTVVGFPLLAVPYAPLVTVLFFMLLFNTIGAVGDFYALYRLLRMPPGTLLYDISPAQMFVYEPK